MEVPSGGSFSQMPETNLRVIRGPINSRTPKLEVIDGLHKLEDKITFQTQTRHVDSLIQEESIGGVINQIRIRQMALPPPFFPINSYIPVTNLEISCVVDIKWAFTFISNLPSLVFVRFGCGAFNEEVKLDSQELRWPLCVARSVRELHISADPNRIFKKKDKIAVTQLVNAVNRILHYADTYLKSLENAEFLVPCDTSLDHFLNRHPKILANGKEKKYYFEQGVVLFTTIKRCNNNTNNSNSFKSPLLPTPKSEAAEVQPQPQPETTGANGKWWKSDKAAASVPAMQHVPEIPDAADGESETIVRSIIHSPSPSSLAPMPAASSSPISSPGTSTSTIGIGEFQLSPSLARAKLSKRKNSDEYEDHPHKSVATAHDDVKPIRITEEFISPTPTVATVELTSEFGDDDWPAFSNRIKICNIASLFSDFLKRRDSDDTSSFESSSSDDFTSMIPATRMEDRSTVTRHNQNEHQHSHSAGQGPVQDGVPADPDPEPEVVVLDEEFDDAKFRTLFTRPNRKMH